VITGPARLDLDHFAVTPDGDGAAVVDSTQVVPPSTRTTT